MFALLLLFFLLPFLDVTCQGTSILQFNGYELAFGKELPHFDMPDFGLDTESQKKPERSSPEIPLVLALLAIVGALVIVPFLEGKARSTVGIVLSGWSLLCLIVGAAKVNHDISSQGEGMLLAKWQMGFYLSLLLLVLLVIQNAMSAASVSAPEVAQAKNTSTPLGTVSGQKFCAQCGSRNKADDRFCRDCGASLS
jgi:hypothetical protein